VPPVLGVSAGVVVGVGVAVIVGVDVGVVVVVTAGVVEVDVVVVAGGVLVFDVPQPSINEEIMSRANKRIHNLFIPYSLSLFCFRFTRAILFNGLFKSRIS
jgi:hypothetical protein